MDIRPSYNCIVVGAGMSGLMMSKLLRKRYPEWTIALAERYKGFGGRTYTYHVPDSEIHWEMGAGRIHKDHTLMMNLLKEYGLTWVPIGSKLDYKAGPTAQIEPDPFESMIVPVYIEPLKTLKPSVLANQTIEDAMTALYGGPKTKKLLSYFPYRAEVNTLRADLALDSFVGGEMGSHEGYGVVAEGFSELVKRMREELEAEGIVMLPRHRLVNLQSAGGKATDLTFEFSDDDLRGHITLRAEHACVLALHRDAVAELKPFQSWSTLQHLKCQPLLRTYAIFPTQSGTSWFSGLNRIVTPMRPRYILPMDAKKGVIMISYTDADDSKAYSKLQTTGGDKALEATIVTDVRTLFPDRNIPDPTFFRSHPWTTGATYWLPGTYSPAKESESACYPLPRILPGVFLCGESWSLRQAWVEGALEHTQQCFQKLVRLIE